MDTTSNLWFTTPISGLQVVDDPSLPDQTSTAIKRPRTRRAYDARTMATIIKRPYGFQLRISHKLLTKDLWATFDTREAAEQYGRQLEGLLAQGIVPAVGPFTGRQTSRMFLMPIDSLGVRRRQD